jgi:hypothetical protein
MQKYKFCGARPGRMGVGHTIFVETSEAKGTAYNGYLGVVGTLTF